MTNGTASLLADLATLWPAATPSFFARLLELYPAEDFNSTFWKRAQIFGDAMIDCPSYYVASALADAGMPAYKMIFDAGSQVHTATQPFLYGASANGSTTANNATLAAWMKDWFVSFALAEDPNAISFLGNASKPFWPTYLKADYTGFQVMDVNYTMVGVTEDFDASARCDFFHAQSYFVRN